VLVRIELHSNHSGLLIEEISVLRPTIKRAQAAVRMKKNGAISDKKKYIGGRD
jgi:hypothetical protein